MVLDEHGGTAGSVTTEDLFEEVVGDVGDAVTFGAVRVEVSTVVGHGVGEVRATTVRAGRAPVRAPS